MDDIELNFVELSRNQVLQRYSTAVRQFRQLAELNYGVRPLLFDNYVICQYFRQRSSELTEAARSVAAPTTTYLKLELLNSLLDRRRQIVCWLFYLTLLSLCVAAYRYEVAGNAGSERGSGDAHGGVGLAWQSYSYPSMRIWRRMTMPIIQRFPRLTELYDESCLMGNPFFQLEDLSCRPCAQVESVWVESEECATAAAAVAVAAVAASATVATTAMPLQGNNNESSSELGAGSNSKANANANSIGNGFGMDVKQQCQRSGEHVPFVFKSNQQPIELVDFYQIYANNHKIFQRDAYRVHSTSQHVHNLEELFGQFNNTVSTAAAAKSASTKSTLASSTSNASEETIKKQSSKKNNNRKNKNIENNKPNMLDAQQAQTHNMWRCNRMLPARLLRPIFARPPRLPSMGVALERYIAIDTPQAPAYSLPETECPNVYVHQAVGTRFIILRPTSECRQRCRTLSMHLTQSFVLSYNWLYWKPISAPDPISETLSISLIGSYC